MVWSGEREREREMRERERERESQRQAEKIQRDRGGRQDTISAGWGVNGVLAGSNIDEA